MAAFSYHHRQSTHVQHEDLTNVSSPFSPYSYFYSPPTTTPSHSTTSQHPHSNQSSSMDNTTRKNNTNTEGKRRKQKRSRSEVKDGEKGGASKCDGDVGKKKKKKKKNQDQLPQTGYIHVRARRGQATDSHSLAERVRREKISERMKILQGLVPGCDKIVGKAIMLDEIINYVQSLQNQVEFLSARLAYANPSVYHFGADLDGHMLQPQQGLESMTGAVQQTAHIEPTTIVEGTNNYPIVDTSAPFPHHGHGPSVFPQQNDGFVMPMDEQSQMLLLDQFQFSNMCNFH